MSGRRAAIAGFVAALLIHFVASAAHADPRAEVPASPLLRRAGMQVLIDVAVELRLQAQVHEQTGPGQDDGHHRGEDQGDAQPDRQAAQCGRSSLRR